MEFLYKVKDAPAHLHNLSVTHDLTKNEREEIKTKVEEAKERELNESGDYICMEGEGKSRFPENSKTPEEGINTNSLAINNLLITYTNVDTLANKLQELKTLVSNLL